MTSKSFAGARTEPSVHPANPGQGARLTVSFRSDEKHWEENVDLVELLREVLASAGWVSHRYNDWLVTDSGLWLKPQFGSFEPNDSGGVSTTTTIEVAHPILLPEPCFEIQHSGDESFTQSVRAGFEQWVQMDWLVFDDLVAPALRHCHRLAIDYPSADGRTAPLQRRLLLGPVQHIFLDHASAPAPEEDHPFCPCCLFMNSVNAFNPQLKSRGTFGIRLYAARDAAGRLHADCRVNGEVWEAGALALRAYAATWPDRGLETRKQYVLLSPDPRHQP
ncbi:MAG: DUF6348 family protein [Alphaproteobacteria bacterium]|nr:DUF6348 family protein [Alphaproteobacteria bacterium]